MKMSTRSPQCMFELTVCRKAASRHQKQAAADDRKATHRQERKLYCWGSDTNETALTLSNIGSRPGGWWRKEYFDQDSQVRKDFERVECWEESKKRIGPHLVFAARYRNLPIRHLAINCCEKSKSAQYKNPDYTLELENASSMMMIFQRMSEISAGHYWKLNRLIGIYKAETRLWSFGTFLYKTISEG